uniref:Anthranilate-CoA-ACP transferase n=1 Tax=Stigmatella aurantiaca TaxID=41 RepID=A4F5C4_STIAU|nr:anthranilate-CoA-ACP transferase [Stigmatella aurantiaca Sg a15]
MSGANVFATLVTRHLEAGKGERPAYRQTGRTYTYAELERLSARAAGLLHEAGLRRGDRVLCLAGDSVEIIALVLGAFRLGAVAVVANQLSPAAKLRFLCEDTAAQVVIVSSVSASALASWTERPASLRSIWFQGEGEAGSFPRLEESIAAMPPRESVEPVEGTHPACWQYTHGADGTELAVVHSHQGLAAAVEPFARAKLGLCESDVVFSIAKLYFGYGFANSLVFPLAAGACTLLHPGRSDVLTVMELVRREHPTVFFGVPTFYSGILKVPSAAQRFDVSSVRAFVSAGEELSASLARKFKDTFGSLPVNGLGSTEMFHIYIATELRGDSPGSLGTLTPGHEVRLLSASGQPVADGEVGELWVRGPHIGVGYAHHPEHTRRVFVEGWVRTGDLVTRDASGAYVFRGRTDALLKVAGQKTLLFEVEQCLRSHEAVVEAEVQVVVDEDGIRDLLAKVRLREGVAPGNATVRVLRTFMRERLLPHSCPSKIEVLSGSAS